jgi:hypothetical protein
MLSDDSLKKELDDISIELQNKKIDIKETIIDTLAMAFNPLLAQHQQEAKRNRENENIDPQE